MDQAILSEEDRVVVIRFGHDWDPVSYPSDQVFGRAITEPYIDLHEDGRNSVQYC